MMSELPFTLISLKILSEKTCDQFENFDSYPECKESSGERLLNDQVTVNIKEPFFTRHTPDEQNHVSYLSVSARKKLCCTSS